jgi:hypothetical protein
MSSRRTDKIWILNFPQSDNVDEKYFMSPVFAMQILIPGFPDKSKGATKI